MDSNTLSVKYIMEQLTDATEFRKDGFNKINPTILHKEYVKRCDINEVIPIHGTIIEIAINRCNVEYVKFLVKQPNITFSTKLRCIKYMEENLCFSDSDKYNWIEIYVHVLMTFNSTINSKNILTLFRNILKIEKNHSPFNISMIQSNVLRLIRELYKCNKILQYDDSLSEKLLVNIICYYPIIAKEFIFEYEELYKMARIGVPNKMNYDMVFKNCESYKSYKSYKTNVPTLIKYWSYELEELLYEIGYLRVDPLKQSNSLLSSNELYTFYALNDGQVPQIGYYLNMNDWWNIKYYNYENGTKLLVGELLDTFVTANFKLILWFFHMIRKSDTENNMDYMGEFVYLPNDIIKQIIKFLACKTGKNRDRPVRKDNLIYYI